MDLLSVDFVILGMISVYPSSGYDMKVELEKGGAGMFSALTFGSIYPRLKVLEAEGYISSCDANTRGRRRRIHELTAKGWNALADWLAEPPDYPLPMRDELLLKMSLWSAARPGDRATLMTHLRQRREQSVAMLRRIEEWPHNGYSLVSEIGGIALSFMHSRLTAELAWIDTTLAQLAGPPTGPLQDPRDLTSQQRRRRAADLATSELTLADTDAHTEDMEGRGEETE